MASSSTQQDLKIPQKTTKTYQFKFKENGSYIDITGWTLFFTVKTKMTDADNVALISKTIVTHTDPTNGETEISLSSSDTNLTPGNYYYDIKFKDDQTPPNILLIAIGRITIERIVTQRES